jgi:hypothetical protein
MTETLNIIVDVVLIANGVYDLACAASILWLEDAPGFCMLAKLHPTMFAEAKHSQHPVIKRLLSYWLITYGMVRIIAGCHRDNMLDIAAALTYFIEGFCFAYESKVGKTMDVRKVQFVSIVSASMGVFFLIRPFGYLDDCTSR